MISFLEELRNLDGLPKAPAQSGLLTLTLQGDGDVEVISRAKEVLRPVVSILARGSDWPDVDEWTSTLPEWFVRACVPEPTQAEADAWLKRWHSLSPARKAEEEERQPWSLPAWLHWLSPGENERQWRWLDAGTEGHRLWITIEVAGYPTAYGALRWLLRAAGATHINER